MDEFEHVSSQFLILDFSRAHLREAAQLVAVQREEFRRWNLIFRFPSEIKKIYRLIQFSQIGSVLWNSAHHKLL